MRKSIILIEDSDFESWTFKDDDFLWIHLIDRGLTFDMSKDDFEKFYQRIKKTRQNLKEKKL